MRIALVVIGGTYVPWNPGLALFVKPTVHDVVAAVDQIMTDEPQTDAIMFVDGAIPVPSEHTIASLMQDPAQVLHAGLALGTAGSPEVLDCVLPQWMFTSDPDPSVNATSWRMSWRCAFIKTDVIRSLGFLTPQYLTLAGAFLDLGHRYLRAGAQVRHYPGLTHALVPQPIIIPLIDQLRFIRDRIGRTWAAWGALRMVLRGRWSLAKCATAMRALGAASAMPARAVHYSECENSFELMNGERVSVIIPTLNRPAYLRSLLEQMRHQTCPPYEIIVIDQSVAEYTDDRIAPDFADLPLTYLRQTTKGQCSSRNRGIRHSSGEFLLFVDDDDDIPATLIEDHLRTMLATSSDAVSGVAEEAGAGPLHSEFMKMRVADVFPTNNSLLRRCALKHTGLFDLAYDHGQRADGDLGFRLYKSGARMLLSPGISVYHHHAPAGGLRTHGARVVTRASGKRKLFHWSILSVSDLYLLLRHCGEVRLKEAMWISLLSQFSVDGTRWFRFAKGIITMVFLPILIVKIHRREMAARAMLRTYPQIPALDAQMNPEGAM